MKPPEFQAGGRFRVLDDVTYADAPLQGKAHTLQCRLYLPEGGNASPPLLAWFHGGGFVMGHHRRHVCDRIGRRMARAGFAVASVGYRLKAHPEDLCAAAREFSETSVNQTGQHLRGNLCNHRALAAMEDGLCFAQWAAHNADKFGWSDKLVLGGNSAGAITALNMVLTAPAIGLSRPQVQGIYGCSAGYNYPAFVDAENACDMIILHNPDDHKLPVSGTRMLKEKLPKQVELLENASHIHGHFELSSDEKPRAAFRRLIEFVDRVSAL